MNKVLMISLILIFGAFGLKAQNGNVTQVEFTSSSRGGGYQKITISKDSIISIDGSHRSPESDKKNEKSIKSDDWKKIIALLKGIDLNKVPDLPSPTNDRTFDGASHSEIIITIEDGSIYTHYFDNYNPNEKLKPLLEAILSRVE